jgi:uncharacterized protein YwgA
MNSSVFIIYLSGPAPWKGLLISRTGQPKYLTFPEGRIWNESGDETMIRGRRNKPGSEPLHVARDCIIQKGNNWTKSLKSGELMQIWRKLFFRGIGKMGPDRAKSELAVPEFDASQWIAIWLALDNQSPVRGKTAFVKQLFVISKENVPAIDRTFQFFPHRYGPYSKVFELTLTKMIRDGLVRETANQEFEGLTSTKAPRLDYELTPQGTALAGQLVSKIPSPQRMTLDSNKRLLSQMGFWGLIHYVYNNYPEYAIFSEIELL